MSVPSDGLAAPEFHDSSGIGKSPKNSPKLSRKGKSVKSKWSSASTKINAASRLMNHSNAASGESLLADDEYGDDGADTSENDFSKLKPTDKGKGKSKEEGYKQKASLLSRTARHMMSRYQKKVRYKDGDYDLDLTYITPRLIAMSFPASGVEAIYRNNAQDVAAMLQEKHGEAFMIINVAEKSYPSDGLKNQVLDFGWPDHMAPPIDRLLGCVQAMDGWNRSDKNNVCAVHCKGGKGRTGVVVASYMLQAKNFVGQYSAEDAMDHFAVTRFDSKDPMKYGISGKSQRRYVNYFKDIVEGRLEVYDRQMFLESVELNCVPDYDSGCCRPVLRLAEFPAGDTQLRDIFEWPPDYSHLAAADRPKTEFTQSDGKIIIPVNILIKLGDIVAFCSHNTKSSKDKKKRKLEPIWRLQFHTCTVKNFIAAFNKDELDDTKVNDLRLPQTGMVSFKFCPTRTPKPKPSDVFNLGEGLKMAFEKTEPDLLMPDFQASKMKMSAEDRLRVMELVKDGVLSVDEAVAQVLENEKARHPSVISRDVSDSESEEEDTVDVLKKSRVKTKNGLSERRKSTPAVAASQLTVPNPFGEGDDSKSKKGNHRRSRSAVTANYIPTVNPFEDKPLPSARMRLKEESDSGAVPKHARRSSADLDTILSSTTAKKHIRRSSVDFTELFSNQSEGGPKDGNPFDNDEGLRTVSAPKEANPFGDAPQTEEPNPFSTPNTPSTQRSYANPFGDEEATPKAANPFKEQDVSKTTANPFDSVPKSAPVSHKASSKDDGNPFGSTPRIGSGSRAKSDLSIVNPFAGSSPLAPATNTTSGEEATANPFAEATDTSVKPSSTHDVANPFSESSGSVSRTETPVAPPKSPRGSVSVANPFAEETPQEEAVEHAPSIDGNPFGSVQQNSAANPFAE